MEIRRINYAFQFSTENGDFRRIDLMTLRETIESYTFFDFYLELARTLNPLIRAVNNNGGAEMVFSIGDYQLFVIDNHSIFYLDADLDKILEQINKFKTDLSAALKAATAKDFEAITI